MLFELTKLQSAVKNSACYFQKNKRLDFQPSFTFQQTVAILKLASNLALGDSVYAVENQIAQFLVSFSRFYAILVAPLSWKTTIFLENNPILGGSAVAPQFKMNQVPPLNLDKIRGVFFFRSTLMLIHIRVHYILVLCRLQLLV